MGLLFLDRLWDRWPFSSLKANDLVVSDRLVKKLSVPENTKQFVFVIPEPETGAVVYVVCAQNLSERSARDVENLIREVKPDVVFAQLGSDSVLEGQCRLEELESGERTDRFVPTSAFGVMARCLLDKLNKESYDDIAGNLVLKEIFGVGFYGHFFVAKRTAEEVGSSFFVLESPSVVKPIEERGGASAEGDNRFGGLALDWNNLVPQKLNPASSVNSSSRRLLVRNNVPSEMFKAVSASLSSSLTNVAAPDLHVESGTDSTEPRCNYQPPAFAQAVYPLLLDLQDFFFDIPSLSRALGYAQKMLLDIERGEDVDSHVLSEVYTFQIAVEGLRIALNNFGRRPLHKMGNHRSDKIEFDELSREEKSHCLLAQAIRSQTKKYDKIVAVVDASCLADLRKHWNTPVPLEVRNEVEELVVSHEFHTKALKDGEKKRLLSDKPVVAVGAGATAILGASSLSKVPISTVFKIATMNVPAALKILVTQTHKTTAIALSKILGSMKVVSPGLATSGAKVSTIKAAASAEKIRTVTHSVLASAEKASFSAMRTAFYEIMRNRHVKPVGFLPWATFGCSISTCAGLLVYGDGIECAIESLPTAPSIANLGRGIQSLQVASLAARESGRTRIQMTLEAFMQKFKKMKIQ